MTEDPKEIYQTHLEAASRAALDGDVEAALDHVALPLRIVTADHEVILSTPEEIGLVVRDYAARLKAEGVIDEQERCIEARFVSGRSDMIAGANVTEWHRADGATPHRFINRLVLMKFGEAWKLVSLESGLGTSDVEAICPDFVAQKTEDLRAIARLHA